MGGARSRRGSLALLLGVSSVAWAAPPRPASSPWSVEAAAQLETGAFSGLGVRKEAGARLRPQLQVEPQLELDRFRASVPVSLSHAETFGARLDESRGSGGLELRWRFSSKLRVALAASVAGVYRPQWSDLYQPLPTGDFARTDRYSHWDRRVEAQLASRPWRRQHARLKYRYTIAEYAVDPAFEPVRSPNHLTPFSHDEHRADFSWRYLQKDWKLGVGLFARWRRDGFLFARDAGSGLTHAGPGGLPPNPLQAFRTLEPSVEGRWRFSGTGLELAGEYGVEVNDDLYQGYYSYWGHHPKLALEYQVPGGTKLALVGEATLRRYGPNSYQPGASHPPLAFGDRRVDQRGEVAFELEVPLGSALALTGRAAWVRRVTNFPSYEPWVFPATRAYDIDWSYTNLEASLGLRWKLSSDRSEGEE